MESKGQRVTVPASQDFHVAEPSLALPGCPSSGTVLPLPGCHPSAQQDTSGRAVWAPRVGGGNEDLRSGCVGVAAAGGRRFGTPLVEVHGHNKSP